MSEPTRTYYPLPFSMSEKDLQNLVYWLRLHGLPASAAELIAKAVEVYDRDRVEALILQNLATQLAGEISIKGDSK
jgi:hypothetical protein